MVYYHILGMSVSLLVVVSLLFLDEWVWDR